MQTQTQKPSTKRKSVVLGFKDLIYINHTNESMLDEKNETDPHWKWVRKLNKGGTPKWEHQWPVCDALLHYHEMHSSYFRMLQETSDELFEISIFWADFLEATIVYAIKTSRLIRLLSAAILKLHLCLFRPAVLLIKITHRSIYLWRNLNSVLLFVKWFLSLWQWHIYNVHVVSQIR